MNTETFEIYTTREDVDAARKRGEPIVELSETEAQKLQGMNREQRRAHLSRRNRNEARR